MIVMLKKFSVENFKGFQDKITFDIGSPSNYNFNSEIIKNENCFFELPYILPIDR